MATEFECDHCGSTARYLDRPAVYELAGADFPCEPLYVHSRPAWCSECNTLVDAEHLRGVDFHERQLAAFQSAELSDRDHEFIAMTKRMESQYRQSVEDAWRIALCAARDRQSPPRCFKCGSTEISYIHEYDPESHEIGRFSHPDCDGSFVCTGSFFVNLDILYLDSEGNRLNGDSTVT